MNLAKKNKQKHDNLVGMRCKAHGFECRRRASVLELSALLGMSLKYCSLFLGIFDNENSVKDQAQSSISADFACTPTIKSLGFYMVIVGPIKNHLFQ